MVAPEGADATENSRREKTRDAIAARGPALNFHVPRVNFQTFLGRAPQMLSHLRHLPQRAACSGAARRRAISSSAVARQQVQTLPVEEEDDDPKRKRRAQAELKDESYDNWLSTTGKKFKDPVRPRNWLGGEPFPLNPSFKPPPPVSNQLRTMVWNEFISDPNTFNERLLAERYGMSIVRVRAILRLKGLEEHWQKNEAIIVLIVVIAVCVSAGVETLSLNAVLLQGKLVQTGFQLGMEEILGINQDKERIRDVVFKRGQAELGEDATGADLDADGVDRARDRYQRLFWEPVVEGKEPVAPVVIEEARAAAKVAKREEKVAKVAQVLPPRDPTAQTQVVVQRPQRSFAVKFVDVRGKFVIPDEILHRRKEAQRRKEVKRRKYEKLVERIAQSTSES
ncbi:hypothetical protein CERSUDRAFT_121039 [Gelatoporia subvermispora B]|uniref:Uncharacterized protein n=1 Tax=Ceriporiopsis subvermispora (strain B) TaxID=914234 RepID=M2RCX3_CERS8|nr:hypothetical protein CERSUDRAFT_121039 [Gelatoporia subvermispora B]